MRALDKTSLLFEMLLGSDMSNVNRKIEEVRFSDEYIRVSNFIPAASSTQLGKDIVEKFNNIDIYAVLSMQRILEVEKEIKELDRRIKNLPTVNPYLANGSEADYKVHKVGEIRVELNSEGRSLDEFTSVEGVTASNRKKALKHKLFNWYIEAKKGLADSIDNSKLMLSRIRYSKVKIRSIFFENLLLTIATFLFLGFIVFSKSFAGYRAGTGNALESTLVTCFFVVTVLLTGISRIIYVHYKSYPFRVASKLRNQIVSQKNLASKLETKAFQFEKSVIKDAEAPFKIRQQISKLSIMGKKQDMTNQDLFDYVYCEKEYYMHKKKGLLIFHNIIFALGLLLTVFAIMYVIVF